MSAPYDSSSRDKPARRRLLKVLASGSGAVVGMKTLPAHWTQPVLDTVALPAHAQTSPEGLSLTCSIDNIQSDNGFPATPTLVVTVSGAVVGNGDPSGIQIDIEGVLTESGTPAPETVENENVLTAADGTYGPVDLTFDEPCLVEIDEELEIALRDGVQVTTTSPDPRLDGETAICTEVFTKCVDVFGGPGF